VQYQQRRVTMETDSLLMDDAPSTSTAVSHRCTSAGGILSRSSNRHVVPDSSDEELLDVDLPSPDVIPTQADDRPHGTNMKSGIL